mmetsp:Transcript_137193/g.273785  ORF Transcript_137193/g.273785 Transcript_137193/m.273785 type:complete len:225 (+) Transcript_137193:102-776(+)
MSVEGVSESDQSLMCNGDLDNAAVAASLVLQETARTRQRLSRYFGFCCMAPLVVSLGCMSIRSFGAGLPRAAMNDFVSEHASIPGRHQIKNLHSGKCLDWQHVLVKQVDCEPAHDTQHWAYQETHSMKTASGGRCLDSGGKNVHVWTCSKNGDVSAHQHWTYNWTTNQLRSLRGHCLSAGSGALGLLPCEVSSRTQRWELADLGKKPVLPWGAAVATHSFSMPN